MRAFLTKYGIWLLLPALALTCLLFLPTGGHSGDLQHWLLWTRWMTDHGVGAAYKFGQLVETDYGCNYPPVYLYLLRGFGLFVQNFDALAEQREWFKLIPFAFDLAAVFLVWQFLREQRLGVSRIFLLVLNPVFWYDSLIWGQVDALLTTLVAATLIVALRGHWKTAVILFVLTLNTKLQAIVYLPVVFLTLMPQLRSWRNIGWVVVLSLLTQAVLLLPFLLAGTLSEWYYTITGLVDQYRNVSLFADNFWHLVLPEKHAALYAKDHQPFWFGLTYKTWGLGLFLLSGGLALLPLAVRAGFQKVDLKNSDFRAMVLLTATLCTLVFFYFNTQMHERYTHPAILLSFLFGVLRGSYWIYGLVSLAFFLNVERVLGYFELHYHTLIFQEVFVAGVYLLAIILAFWELYRGGRKGLRF